MNDTLYDFLNLLKKKSEQGHIYIYGAGMYGRNLARLFQTKSIEWNGFIDKKDISSSDLFYNKHIFCIDKISLKQSDFVVVSLAKFVYADEFDAVKKTLISKGIERNNIIFFTNYSNLVNEVIYEVNNGSAALKKNVTLKDKYKNRRCVIIGNGPSLRIDDLNKLNSEITMGCNGIIQVLDYTKWRPTFFFCEDNTFLRENVKDEESLKKILGNCSYLVTNIKGSIYERYKLKYKNVFYTYFDFRDSMDFSEDICKRVSFCGTTLYSMMQFAVYMGITEIYLIGVDFSFRREISKNGKETINDNVCNHMNKMDQVNAGVYHVDLIMEGYICAKRFCDEHGIKIYNATRGGKLEVFPRVDFDEVFGGM